MGGEGLTRVLNALNRLLSRPDFRSNPFRAILRRVLWRLRWQATQELWEMTLPGDVRILVPHVGAGALIYYQGVSEPEVADFLLRFLRPRMVFLDVGAHIGEYASMGAKLVAPGRVHAFEPIPGVFSLLQRSLALNGLDNVRLNACAVSDKDGEEQFSVLREPSFSSLTRGVRPDAFPPENIVVRSVRLDTYWSEVMNKGRIDLIKLDIEGAELLALEGASDLLESTSPVLIVECQPLNLARFGHGVEAISRFLNRAGYSLYEIGLDGKLRELDAAAGEPSQPNIVAAKDPWWLSEHLRELV